MKLFIWEGDGVLTDYTNGMIVALANDLQEALSAICKICDYGMSSFPNDRPTSVIELPEGNPQPTAQAWVCWGGG